MYAQKFQKLRTVLRRLHILVRSRIEAFIYPAYENIPCKIQKGCGWCNESGVVWSDPDFNCEHCDGTGVETQHARLSSNGVRLLRLSGFWIAKYVKPNVSDESR